MRITRPLLLIGLLVAISLPPLLAQANLQAAPGGPQVRLLYATFDPLRNGEPAIAGQLRAQPGSRYALLQFSGPPRRQWIEALRQAGVTFYDYVPDYAYVVRLPAAGSDSVALSTGVRWIGALHPAYKISPTAKGGPLLLDLFPDANLAAVEAAVSAAGARVVERTNGAHARLLVVEAGADAIPALAAIEQVRWVQPKPVYYLANDDARWVVQRYQPGQLPLYARGLTGAGQVGGVSDSGLDAYDYVDASGAPDGSNPNEASCYFVDDGNGGAGGAQKLPGPTHRKVISYTVPSGATGDFTDESGHGTHVVGSVVGDRAPWGAVSPADGQAFEARIYFQDINQGGGLTVSPPSNYYDDLFAPAYDPNGDDTYQPAIEPRTHSNSWSSPEPIYDAGTAQADEFMWDHPDFLILYSAGNRGPAFPTVGNPPSAKNIVTVGSTQNGDGNPENMADTSSHGPIPVSNRLKPTIGAPGEGVVSALYNDDCGTQELSGTSMATPTTHGVALLMRQYLWEGFYPLGQREGAADHIHPSAALLKALLINSGRPMSGMFTDNKESGGTWPSNGQGWGRVTADDALYFQGDHRDLWLHDVYALDGSVGFDAAGQTQTATLTVGDGSPFDTEPLEITLVWTDYPGSQMTNGALVNNLNLVVTGPNGDVHRGNNPEENDFRGDPPELVPALDGTDDVNPWEVVYLANPVSGTYTVTVSAENLGSLASDPDRKQGYALVVTGDLLSQRGRAEIEEDAYEVAPSADARLRVVDLDLNTDSMAVETVTTVVTSTTDVAGTTITLTETAPDSAIFAGSVTLIALDDGQSAGPGQLEVHQGDTIRLTYDDADDGTGASYLAYDTAAIASPFVTLFNPPELADPAGATPDEDGAYTLEWDSAETDNGRGGTKTLAYHQIQETTAYVEPLFDNAEGNPPGASNPNWNTSADTTSATPWVQNTLYVHSATRSYWSGVGERVGVGPFTNSLTLKNDVTIPLTVTEGRLTFYSRYFNELDDSGIVDISTDGGTSWTPLLRLTEAPLTEPADTRVQHHEIDLTAFRGSPFRIRYRFGSGTSNFVFYVSRGWWVDDITLSGGSWQTIGTAPPEETSFEVASRSDGRYHYRVRGVFTDGSVTAWSNVEDVIVEGPGQATPTSTPPAASPTATPDVIVGSPTPTGTSTVVTSPTATTVASATVTIPVPTITITALASPSVTGTTIPPLTPTGTGLPATVTATTTGVAATGTATGVPVTPSPSPTTGASGTTTATPGATGTRTPAPTVTGTPPDGHHLYLPVVARSD